METTHEYEHDGVTVRYKLREGQQDRQHLVVVFAAVLPGQHDFYGFDGRTLDNVKGSILWIQDSFDGQNSYYLCAGMDFTIERAISTLINLTLKDLGLGPDNCTLLGGSKGGSAALHLGLKYDYRNIVASVPQSKIGTYTRQRLNDTFTFMAGPDHDSSEAALNEYIPHLVTNPRSHAKNIYLISSEADPEFKVHVEPLLTGLSRYENFNLLLTDSTLVTAHPEVTPYNIPFILSTLYALCEGLVPRFGMVRNGNGQRDRKDAPRHLADKRAPLEPVAGFHWVLVKGDTLSFRAYAAVLGEEVAEEPTAPPRLIAIQGDAEYEFGLESMADPTLNSRLYRKHFCNYLWAGLKAPYDRGVSLGSLPSGRFNLQVSFGSASGSHQTALIHKDIKVLTGVSSGHVYRLDASPAGTRISKLPLEGEVAPDALFRFTVLAVEAQTLFVRGVFAVPREEMRAWNDGDFALTLRNDHAVVSYNLASSNPAGFPLPDNFDPEAFTWAHFSTAGHRGLDLKTLADGDYECFVSFVRSGRVYTGSERFELTVANPSFSLTTYEKACAPTSIS